VDVHNTIQGEAMPLKLILNGSCLALPGHLTPYTSVQRWQPSIQSTAVSSSDNTTVQHTPCKQSLNGVQLSVWSCYAAKWYPHNKHEYESTAFPAS